MANTVFKLRRSSVAGKVPTTSDIAIGELALNLTDKILYSSDGTNVWEIGANNTNQNITGNVSISTNGKRLSFAPLAGGNNVYFTQQSDDNFVFYSTNTSNLPRAVFSIYANSVTSNLNFVVPIATTAGIVLGSNFVSANGSNGAAGQVLTSNGSAAYWSTATGTFSNGTSYTWSQPQTFQANVSFTGNGIAVNSNTGSVYFGGISDANWRISRNAGVTTKFFYTNNTLDIIAASSPKEGIIFGWTGNSYLETGYAGTFTQLPIYVGNNTVNTTINSTSFTGTSNNSLYLGGTLAASYVQNTDSRTLSGNLTFIGANLNITGTNTYITSNVNIGSTASFYSINGQANASGGNFIANAYATLSGAGGNYLAFGQQTNFSQWIQSGFSSAGTPVYYNIVLNPLGGNVGIGNTSPTDKLSINGTTYHGGNVIFGSSGLSANGSYGSAGQSLLSNGSAIYWATAGATLNANNTDTQTFYIGLSNASSGAWTNAVVSTTKLYYVPSTGTLDSTIVNASSHTVGTSFTANSTVVNAVSYYAGTTLIGNTTGPYGKTEGNLNVNNSLTSNTSTYLGNSSGTIANVSSWITTNSSAAYTNAVSYTDGKIATANAAITGNAATAYTNATIFASNASNINTGTLAEARLPFRMNQNVTSDNNVTFGSLTLTGNLTVSGNVTVIGANNLSITDNFIYLNSNNTTQNIDVGISANYNSGGYAHTGIFRDASDGYWKVFDNYAPEPDANVNIDTTNTSFHLANFQANSLYAGNTSSNWFIANTLGAYHTGTINAASHTVGTSTIANATGVYTGTINAASHTVGTSTIANATGVYTGIVNAASHTVGTAFTANATVVNAVSYYAGTTLIGNTTGPYGKTEANLNVNSATQATNATNLNSQPGSYYTNATNISTGTLALARGGTGSSLTAASGGVVYSNATGMAITAAGTNTYVLASNGTVPAWTQIDMAYLPESAFKKSVTAATTADLSAASATAQVLTGGLTVLAPQDGVPMVLNTRLLVKDQSNAAQNGIYYVSNSGLAGVYAWTLTRTADANTASKIASALVAVDTGTINGGKLFDTDFTTSGAIGTTAMSWHYNIDGGGGVFVGSIYPNSNTLLLGNSISRWVISANTIDASGLITGTGGATITGTTNTSTAFQISTTFIANTTGVYHTGTINAASHTVGTIFTVNTTQINISSIPLSANGSNGTAGQVLTSNGNLGAPYWATASAGVNTAAQYTWTNTHTFQANVTVTGNATSVFTVGNSTINVYTNSVMTTSHIGESNPNTFSVGAYSTNASLNTVIAGPYTIPTGNTLTITAGSRVVIV